MANEAHRLPLIGQMGRQRSRHFDGPFGEDLPLFAGIFNAVQIEQDGRFQGNGRLECLDCQLAAVGAGLPVNLAQGIAAAVVADALRASRIFKEPLAAADDAERQAGRQP